MSRAKHLQKIPDCRIFFVGTRRLSDFLDTFAKERAQTAGRLLLNQRRSGLVEGPLTTVAVEVLEGS